jgi:hypothetical protein
MASPLEADIIINGVRLSPAQSMAVRVAITAYHSDMCNPDALGDDEHGRAMTRAYHDRLLEVLRIIIP